MSLIERLKIMLGLSAPTPPDDSTRVLLDSAENRVAGRLSKMTGRTRDEVLAESYRRADAIRRRETLRVEAESMRPRR